MSWAEFSFSLSSGYRLGYLWLYIICQVGSSSPLILKVKTHTVLVLHSTVPIGMYNFKLNHYRTGKTLSTAFIIINPGLKM